MVKLGALAFGLFAAVAQASAQQTVKVMPFGASIVSRCWRANLYTKLRNNNVKNFDFVGTQTSTCAGTSIDQDHEGHPGSQASEYVKNGNLVTWLNANTPDVILMLLGTNDVLLGKRPATEIIGYYDILIGQMRAKNPKMHILISSLLPLDPARWPKTAAEGIVNLNAAIKQYAPGKSTRDSPVVFVDNFADFDAVNDTDDGEHPSPKGNEKMATKFFAPTRDAIKAIASSQDETGSSTNHQGQAQAQAQDASPTLVTSSATAKGTSQTRSSSQASATSLVSVTVQRQATGSATSTGSATTEAKTSGTTQSTSQQTSSATSLRAPWPMYMWRNLRLAVSTGRFQQALLSR